LADANKAREKELIPDGAVVGRIMKAADCVGRPAVAMDAGLRAVRGPHADAWLRADARGGDGGVREEWRRE
jgi:hypothetical protein